MNSKRQISALLIAAMLLLVAAFAAGCGGSDSSAAESADSSTTEASAEFLKPGTKSAIPKFGKEADTAEREAASAVLEENMQAREDEDWETQCATLTAEAIKLVEKGSSPLSNGGCVKDIEALAEPLAQSKAARVNTMTGPIAALRVEGDKGFALYHGAKEVDYTVPMKKEGGEWKVDAISPQEIS